MTKTAVLDFVRQLYDEISSLIIDHMIHVGGDEVSLDCWKESSRIQQWMHQHNMTDEAELMAQFENFLLNHTVNHLNKQPIVWQEMFDSDYVVLPSSVIVNVWKEWEPSSRSRATLLHRVIYSACWYLDHLDQDWRSFYRCDPRDFNGTNQQHANIIGGHASMWGERVDGTNFMSRVWPRASAMAEKLWTGNVSSAFKSSFERLDQFRCSLLEQGVDASPIWVGSCRRSKAWSVE